MVDKCRLKERSTKVQHFISHFQKEKNKMEIRTVGILWEKIVLEKKGIILELL